MLYSYECPKCKKKWDENQSVEDRHGVKCSGCRVKADKLISVEGDVITFKPMWYNDICDKSIYVTSKSQLKEECKKHDVIAARLL